MLPCLLIVVLVLIESSFGFSDVGKWDIPLSGDSCGFHLEKSLFKGAKVIGSLTIHCDAVQATNITVSYQWAPTMCSPDYFHYFEKSVVECPSHIDRFSFTAQNITFPQVFSKEETHTCLSKITIILGDDKTSLAGGNVQKQESEIETLSKIPPMIVVDKEGIYTFSLTAASSKAFNGTVRVEMVSPYGYLSAAIWPLLPFFGVMCAVYTVLCASWLLVCALNWRDLLRIQYWIGGVALLGMVESATYYGVYSSINRTGYFNSEAYMFAEWVSVAKRALARMLVIIVSLGFGIVKPRLGPALQRVVGTGLLWGLLGAIGAWLWLHHKADDGNRDLLLSEAPLPRLGPALQRVVGTGLLWGLLGAIEAWLRLHHKADDGNRDLLLSEAPLSLLDSGICWWVFVSLAHTMRTLQLRRNAIKLSLYRHFTNTLVFAVISSVIFMLYSIKSYRVLACITDWKEVWMDEAYWHILFASVLTVIMVLWRPTNNNQRYAFTPLLDNADDDDEEEEQFVNDAYGVKMRGTSLGDSHEAKELLPDPNSLETDLRWVEENIPTSTLPLLDSDEEIINTKFEVSKMQ